MPSSPRWLQFRLRTLLLVVFAVAAYLGWRRYYEETREIPTPINWDVGRYPRRTIAPAGVPPQSRNIKWSAPLGSYTYSSPVVSGGKVFIGTNNNHGYLPRYPRDQDYGVLLCLDAETGKFLWQHTSEKLPTGRAEDWPQYGVTSTPLVEGDRLWYVNNRAEVVCLDTEGFLDGENDGAVQNEVTGGQEADVVWSLDMRKQLGVHAHEMSLAGPAADRERLFIVTGNGVDDSHVNIPAPDAPSFLALDKQTGKIIWSDNSPGKNILHAQWGTPTYAVIAGVPQAIFPGGDGWLYSFDPAGTLHGESKLLWKFDLNPKSLVWRIGGGSSKNEFAYHVTVVGNRVFVAAGQNWEHGEGPSTLWCLEPTQRGDVSEELVFNKGQLVAPRRERAMDPNAGDYTRPNPRSAVVWKYDNFDNNGNGAIDAFDEEMHRLRGGIVVKNNILVAADFCGLVHFLDADTGRSLWNYDLRAFCWNTPLIAGDHAYICDEDGEVAIFRLSPDVSGQLPHAPIAEINMGNASYSAPAVHRGVLYIANKMRLYAIEIPPK